MMVTKEVSSLGRVVKSLQPDAISLRITASSDNIRLRISWNLAYREPADSVTSNYRNRLKAQNRFRLSSQKSYTGLSCICMRRMSPARRRFIQAMASSFSIMLSGCTTAGFNPNGSKRTDDEQTMTNGTPNGAAPLPAEYYDFDVSVLGDPTADNPGRLQAEFTNLASDAMEVEGDTPNILPFADSDMIGEGRNGETSVFLYPVGENFKVGPSFEEVQPIENFLNYNSQGSCWELGIGWPPPAEERMPVNYKVILNPGKTARHEYELYHVGGCSTGVFMLESTFATSINDRIFGLHLAFNVTIDGGSISVEMQ